MPNGISMLSVLDAVWSGSRTGGRDRQFAGCVMVVVVDVEPGAAFGGAAV